MDREHFCLPRRVMTLRGLLWRLVSHGLFFPSFFFSLSLLEKNHALFAIAFQRNTNAKDYHFHQSVSKRKLLRDSSALPLDAVSVYIRIGGGFGLSSVNSAPQIAPGTVSLHLASGTTPAHGPRTPTFPVRMIPER